MSESYEERLSRLRNWRTEMKAALEQKIAATKRDRDELVQQYDEEIGALETELRELGVPVASTAPNEVAVRAYNYLRENPGQKLAGGQLMRAIRAEGAVASIVLSQMISTGKVKRSGEYRSTLYWVPSSTNEGDQG